MATLGLASTALAELSDALLLRERPQPPAELPRPELILAFDREAQVKVMPPLWLSVLAAEPEDQFDTIILSDTHVGSKLSLYDETLDLLRTTRPDNVILNGDYIDQWHVGSTAAVRLFGAAKERMQEVLPEGAKIVFIPGNHDDVFRHNPHLVKAGTEEGRFVIVPEATLKMPDGTLALVVHGDIFDVTVQNRRVGIVATRFGERLNGVDALISSASTAIGLSQGSPFYSMRKKMEEITARPVETKAYEHLFKLNADIYAWNLANPEAKAPYYHHIVCGHTHRAGRSHALSPRDQWTHAVMGPEKVSYINLGYWVGPPHKKAANQVWRDTQKHPVCTFFGIKKNGESGVYLYHPKKGITLLAEQDENAHYLNPSWVEARNNAAARVTKLPLNGRRHS